MSKQLLSRPKKQTVILPYEFAFRLSNGAILTTRTRYAIVASVGGRRTPPPSGPLVGVEQ